MHARASECIRLNTKYDKYAKRNQVHVLWTFVSDNYRQMTQQEQERWELIYFHTIVQENYLAFPFSKSRATENEATFIYKKWRQFTIKLPELRTGGSWPIPICSTLPN